MYLHFYYLNNCKEDSKYRRSITQMYMLFSVPAGLVEIFLIHANMHPYNVRGPESTFELRTAYVVRLAYMCKS